MASVSLLGLSPLAKAAEPKTLPDYVRWKNANDVIVHSANTIETERGAIGSGVVTGRGGRGYGVVGVTAGSGLRRGRSCGEHLSVVLDCTPQC